MFGVTHCSSVVWWGLLRYCYEWQNQRYSTVVGTFKMCFRMVLQSNDKQRRLTVSTVLVLSSLYCHCNLEINDRDGITLFITMESFIPVGSPSLRMLIDIFTLSLLLYCPWQNKKGVSSSGTVSNL